MKKLLGISTVHFVEESGANAFRIPLGNGSQNTIRITGSGAGPYTHIRFGDLVGVTAEVGDPNFGPDDGNGGAGYDFTFARGEFPSWVSFFNDTAASPGHPGILSVTIAVGY